MSTNRTEIIVRNTGPDDFAGVIQLTQEIYPAGVPWRSTQLF